LVRRPRQGYTLFEVVLVLALLVLLAAITFPSLDAMYGDSKVTAAGDMVRGAWAEAQARAMDEGRAYRFAVLPNQGNYRVAPDSADFWSGNGSSAATDAAVRPLILEDKLPKPVLFTTANGPTSALPEVDSPAAADSGSWTPVVTFLPDGTARNDATITLVARGCRPVILRIRGLTGVITVRTPEASRP
jgi:prepilin-type N-terminal cleavage/methylation domain-containing protein